MALKLGDRQVRRSGLGAVALVAVLLVSAACGGNAPTAPTPSPTPTPTPSPSAVTITGTVSAYAIASHEVNGPAGRTLAVTLTWTTGVDLDLYLTDIECTGYPPDRCHVLARSTASTGQREEVTWPVTQAARFKVWVDNFSRTSSSAYSLEVAVR